MAGLDTVIAMAAAAVAATVAVPAGTLALQAAKGRTKWTRRLETAGIQVHTEAKVDTVCTECRATPQHDTG